MWDPLPESVSCLDNKAKYLRPFFIVLVLLLFVSYYVVYHYGILLGDKHTSETSTDDDELVKSALKIESRYSSSREKRSVDVAAYREMGWKFTPSEAKMVFDAYYRCITERKYALAEKSHIKAVLALEGQVVKLECATCFRPDQDPSAYDFEWQQLRIQDGVLRYVEENKRITISKDKTLIISEVDVIDAGQYFCVQTNIREYVEIYQLDVVFKENRVTLPEDRVNDLLKPVALKEHNLRVFTFWSGWSMCNQCNKIGKRRKVGMCMIQKIYSNKPIEPIDIPIISLYPDGIPCRSTVLPKEVSRMRDIRFRPSETIMGDCYIECPTTPAFLTVTDKNGNIVETIDAGFYSMKSKPTLPPMVARKVIYTNKGENLVLTCPNSDEAKSLIRWQNGSFPLNPLTIRRQTRGRVKIDGVNRLEIRGLRYTDMAIYSCWSNSKLVCTIKVIITEGVDKSVHLVITKVGVCLTVVSLVVSSLCSCYSRATKKATF